MCRQVLELKTLLGEIGSIKRGWTYGSRRSLHCTQHSRRFGIEGYCYYYHNFDRSGSIQFDHLPWHMCSYIQ